MITEIAPGKLYALGRGFPLDGRVTWDAAGKFSGVSPGSTPDVLPPTIAITQPTNSASVTGTVNVAVSAADNAVGFHPSPTRAARRRAAVELPATTIGTPPACAGRGAKSTAGKPNTWPLNSTGDSVHKRRIPTIASSNARPRTRNHSPLTEER